MEKHITTQFKNKLIIMDNASSHRNPMVKDVITQHNHLLYLLFIIFIITLPYSNQIKSITFNNIFSIDCIFVEFTISFFTQ